MSKKVGTIIKARKYLNKKSLLDLSCICVPILNVLHLSLGQHV